MQRIKFTWDIPFPIIDEVNGIISFSNSSSMIAPSEGTAKIKLVALYEFIYNKLKKWMSFPTHENSFDFCSILCPDEYKEELNKKTPIITLVENLE